MIKGLIRIRMSSSDAHYGGQLVDGAKLMGMFGDVATELLIRQDEDEGLFVAYESVEFKAPVYAGDYIEAVGEIVNVGRTSRKMNFLAYKVIEAIPSPSSPSKARVCVPPILVATAVGTCVVPMDRQKQSEEPHHES
jgi:3-aminobutyryl-CoA ammonia-lyase